jgi:hypothetical protein
VVSAEPPEALPDLCWESDEWLSSLVLSFVLSPPEVVSDVSPEVPGSPLLVSSPPLAPSDAPPSGEPFGSVTVNARFAVQSPWVSTAQIRWVSGSALLGMVTFLWNSGPRTRASS